MVRHVLNYMAQHALQFYRSSTCLLLLFAWQRVNSKEQCITTAAMIQRVQCASLVRLGSQSHLKQHVMLIVLKHKNLKLETNINIC